MNRTVRLSGTVVEIVIGRRRTVYHLHRAGRAWKLTKATGTTYRVQIGRLESCTCPAGLYRGIRCKHAAAIAALAQRGLLPRGAP